MPLVMVQKQPEMFRPEMYDSVNAKLGDLHADPPDGLIAHTIGQDDQGQWRVVDIWESREAHDRFAEDRLRPAIRETMRENGIDPDEAMPAIEQVFFETYDYFGAAAGAG